MITGDDKPGNLQPPPEITMNIGLFLMIIFIIVGIAALIAFICYHAKDKKIKQLNKLIQIPLSEREQQLILNYRNLSDNEKQIVDNATSEILGKDTKNTEGHNLSKG